MVACILSHNLIPASLSPPSLLPVLTFFFKKVNKLEQTKYIFFSSYFKSLQNDCDINKQLNKEGRKCPEAVVEAMLSAGPIGHLCPCQRQSPHVWEMVRTSW